MQSFQVTQNVISEGKQIVQNPSEGVAKDVKKFDFEENEVYALDIYMSTGSGRVSDSFSVSSVTCWSLSLK